MKSKKKVFLTVLCAAALVVASVLGTMAFLTSKTDKVTNTFTVGKVAITLDEAKTNENGTPVTGAERVKANNYKLIPGHKYTKDPTIHVDSSSEKSYVFVKVVNNLATANAEAAKDDNYKTVAGQMDDLGWKQLVVDGNTIKDTWYKEVAVDKGTDVDVFKEFRASGTLTNEQLQQIGTKTIEVTGYAIQADGFNSAVDAWKAAAPQTW